MVCIDCGKETSNFRYYADVDVEICDGCVDKAARNHVMVLLAFKRRRLERVEQERPNVIK